MGCVQLSAEIVPWHWRCLWPIREAWRLEVWILEAWSLVVWRLEAWRLERGLVARLLLKQRVAAVCAWDDNLKIFFSLIAASRFFFFTRLSLCDSLACWLKLEENQPVAWPGLAGLVVLEWPLACLMTAPCLTGLLVLRIIAPDWDWQLVFLCLTRHHPFLSDILVCLKMTTDRWLLQCQFQFDFNNSIAAMHIVIWKKSGISVPADHVVTQSVI